MPTPGSPTTAGDAPVTVRVTSADQLAQGGRLALAADEAAPHAADSAPSLDGGRRRDR